MRRWWKALCDRIALVALFVLLGWILSGCASAPELVEIRVPVPVACEVAEPARPDLSIDSISPDAPLDVQVRNLRADHDVRDGYEGELRAALKACREMGAPP